MQPGDGDPEFRETRPGAGAGQCGCCAWRGDGIREFAVLGKLDGDRHLVIDVGHAEAFALAVSLQGRSGRPMTYWFTAALVRSLGGRVREVRLDRIVEGAYAATVEVDGPQGAGLADARSSDALNLAVLTDAPVFVSPDVLADSAGRQQGDSAEAALLQRAIRRRPSDCSQRIG